MDGSFYEGILNGDIVKCPNRDAIFDVRTGKAVKNGKIAFIWLKASDTQAHPVKG